MKRQIALIALVIFSLCWLGWTFMMLLGATLADCFSEAYSRCWAGKEYAPALILWRGLAVELVAILAYLLFAPRRIS